MTKLYKIGLGQWAVASFAFTLSACGFFWAGGVDEQQNTVAGVSDETENGSNVAPNTDSQNCYTRNDTTYCIHVADANLPIGDTLVQSVDSVHLDPVNVDRHDSALTPTPIVDVTPVKSSYSIKGYVATDKGTTKSIEVALKDSTFVVQGNSDGSFELAIPEGTRSFIVKSETQNGYVSVSNYYLIYGSGINVVGPVPTSVAGNVDAEDLEAPPVQTVEMPPVSGMTPDPGPVFDPPDTSATTIPMQSSFCRTILITVSYITGTNRTCRQTKAP